MLQPFSVCNALNCKYDANHQNTCLESVIARTNNNQGLLLDLLEKLRKNLNYTKKCVSVCVSMCTPLIILKRQISYISEDIHYVGPTVTIPVAYFTVLYFENS